MKKIISIISVIILLVTTISFASCKKEEPQEEEKITTAEKKTATSEAVEIVDLPDDIEGRVDMLNAAIEYFDVYCTEYKKNFKCTVESVSVGSLSEASNAVDAFKSIFGETTQTAEYNYDTAPESFAKNVVSGEFDKSDVISADVKQEGQEITLTVTFPNESNLDAEDGILKNISPDYVSVDDVKSALDEFESSAGSVSVTASDITVTAVINSVDSSVQKMTVSYTENFSLSTVKLVELEGSSVTAKSKNVITYSNFK